MSKEYLNPPELFPSQPFGFSQIVITPPGKLVFISGQVAWNAKREIVGKDDFRTQVFEAFKNLKIAIEKAGGRMTNLVSLRIYIVEDYLDKSTPVREALHHYFPMDAAPTTTWIGVRGLANPDFLIEVEAMGVI